MRKIIQKMISLTLAAVLLLSLVPAMTPTQTQAVTAEHYNSYTTITLIPNQDGCPSMQGCDVDTTYMYCSKINNSTETSANIVRINVNTGDYVYMTNGDNGTTVFTQLAHANDLAITDVNGVKTLFVGTGGAGTGDYSLVRHAVNGTTLTQVGHYNVKLNGTSLRVAGVKVVSVSDTEIELIFKRSKYIYRGTLDVNATSGDLNVEQIATLDIANVTINGTVMDLTNYVEQGFGYADGKIFVPFTGDESHINESIVAVYDVEGVSGTIRNDPSLTVRIVDTTYVDLFEIESVAISSYDGRMYFSTNRRKVSGDGSSDGVHYVKNYLYQPERGDTTYPNFRWETQNDRLVSVTDGGAVYSNPLKQGGKISGGTFQSSRYHIDQSVTLKHDQPWIIEYKSAGTGSGTLWLSESARSHTPGNRYIYRRKGSSVLAFGEYADNNYQNYGIDLSKHGIDVTKTHVYSFRNVVNSDGSNMIYLYIDGTKIGAMNNYFLGGTAQNTTSNWVSGKDFTFSYLGTVNHPITNCTLEYMQVWAEGIPGQLDEPNTYRWEAGSAGLTNITQTGFTANTATRLTGSNSGDLFTDGRFVLEKEITLLHDRNWSIQWQSDSWSYGMLLTSVAASKQQDGPYLYRSGIIALGYFDGTYYRNHGVMLSDHGIDGSVSHVYRLTNHVNADGSNMVYLYVDDVQIGAMNNYYLGTTSQGTTSDWLNGKDLSFRYVGNQQYPITNSEMSYLQVWENGIPDQDKADTFRWEPVSNKLTSITTEGFSANEVTVLAGSISGDAFTNSYFRMEKSVVLNHDRLWSIEWQSEGSWKDSSNGAMLLSASKNRNEPNGTYLYRRNDSTFIALGERADNAHQNYGVSLSGHGIDGTVSHVYKLENRINTDGSNMVYLFVDGKEIGPMNEYFLGGTAQNTTNNWVSGKDFVFSYLGTPQFPIGACNIDYIQINEGGCDHVYGAWGASSATCETAGTKSRTCTLCGHVETEAVPATGHSYTGTVTKPTCTAQGYTTYTCTCGDSYVSDYVAASGHSYKTVVTAPSCTAQGYTTYTCACGDSYISDYVAASGHSYSSTVTKAPTCENSGVRTYTCGSCGHGYTEAISATGHTYKLVVTEPTCTVGGYTTYTCECGNSYVGSYTDPIDHSWDNGSVSVPPSCTVEGVKTCTCTSCGATKTESIPAGGHTFVNGTCLFCGAADQEAIVSPTITLATPTLLLEDSIKLNIYYTIDQDIALEKMGMITWKEKPSVVDISTADNVYTGATFNSGNGYYGVNTDGIPAQNLGDIIYFCIYAELADGTIAYSKQVQYSPSTYAYNQLKSNSATPAAKALFVAILNYGAAAQTYLNDTDALVNASLTDEMKALVEAYNSDMVHSVSMPAASKQGALASNGGFKNKKPTIALDGAFAINYYFDPSATVSGDMTFYYWNAADFAAVDVLSVDNATGSCVMTKNGDEYGAAIEGIAAKDIDSALYACGVYTDKDGNTYSTGILPYSLGFYCGNQVNTGTAEIQPLAAAIAVYGYYAAAYFAN